MTRAPAAPTIGRAARIGIVLGVLASSLMAATASAAPLITRSIDIHFSRSQHFDADPSCGPGVTEVQEGNHHLVIVDDGTWFNVTAGETFTITVIPDDPSIPTSTRKVTALFHYRLQPDGDEIFHQTFRDFGGGLKIQFMWTWITRDGEVTVDHAIIGDEPPAGC
jgi:hypothetical protein